MTVLSEKFKEVFFSVLPVTVFALILHFTLVPLDAVYLIRFLFGVVLIVLGLTVFLLGVDIGVTPVGNLMGEKITETNKIMVVAIASFILGFFISAAEPDLLILATQVNFVTAGLINKWSIVTVVSVGIGLLLTAGFIRILRNYALNKLLMILYFIILILAFFVTPEFLAVSFDSSGATTGALTVPFILALSAGISALKRDSRASEQDSFGLIAITSTGAIISVMIMCVFSKADIVSANIEYSLSETGSFLMPFVEKLSEVFLESVFALAPLLILFLIFQKITFRLKKRSFRKILKGLLYTLIGLTLFLTGVNAGFIDVGKIAGYNLAALENKFFVIAAGFILGVSTVLAEPAVHVLTEQIETITTGYVSRKTVLAALSVGVGIAIALSVVRILVTEIKLWHFLLPGYISVIAMSFIVPKLFVGIAFDSGGVASGPMTATFILAFAQGAAQAAEGADVLIDGFGIIAMVALMPIISLEILGLIYKFKSKKGGLKQDES